MGSNILFKKLLLLSTLVSGMSVSAIAQTDSIKLNLQQVVQMAKQNSIAEKQAVTTRETKYWEWRTFKSNYQPQLALSGILPGYSKTFTQVMQPNGTVLFQPIHNDISSLELNFSQSISATGGSVYGSSTLQRFSDFDRNNVLYNGRPYSIGISQPLFQYNQLKWDKKIEPLKYKESTQAFVEAQEKIAINVTGYFFDLLLAQVNHKIAKTNLDNTQRIMGIAKLKFELGKVSKNEILQLELEELNSRKALGTALRDMEIATLTLRSYIGMESNDKIVLDVPAGVNEMVISSDKVLSEALENRSQSTAFVRRIAEAKRDVAKAKGQSGLVAALTANLGFSNTATNIPDIYRSPQQQQLVQLQFSIPIMDWGRSKSRTKTAEANEQLVNYEVEQDKQIFQQEIVTQVTLFNMMRGQLSLTNKADEIASEKYQIAKERYVLGDLSITDLSIAFSQNDQAKRDHISSLRDLWGAYYQLRYLSLYDFEKNQKINYNKQ